jgi:hypothetical protein
MRDVDELTTRAGIIERLRSQGLDALAVAAVRRIGLDALSDAELHRCLALAEQLDRLDGDHDESER